ncbi:uncharacterized protein LOC131996976 [Stomoxys calcitrans]|uniref:uncharacterized protein LOC131996976 n=1 Tax=Stomoxys calcitrans TaxID=35570 RepID=UPI0027E21FAE|nr:uncharacterized protein LOC131996976 [Stomoxys calcitrans]
MAESKFFIKFRKLVAVFLDFENEYNAMNNDDHTMFTVELRKAELNRLWNRINTAYESFSVECDGSENEEEASRLYRQCREAYISCAAQMGELSQSFANHSTLSSTMASPHQVQRREPLENRFLDHRLRLPPCTTEVFHGDYLSWPSFRDMFTAVYIDCKSITPVEELFYLRQSTQGEALEIVKKSPLTNDGFENAWSNLKSRYENKRILVNSQLKILFNLGSVKSESAGEINRLQRDINNCITALKLHEIDIHSWDPIFVFLCSTKLPTNTLSLWEQTVRNKTEISKWSDLDDFLTARFQSLETVYDLTHSHEVKPTDTKDSHEASRSSSKVKSYQTNMDKRLCFVCSQDHVVKSCPRFLEMNQEQRFITVKRNNLCLNCFSSNHKLNQCTSKFSCSKCKLRHHTLLHKESRQLDTEDMVNLEAQPGTSRFAAQNAASDESRVQNCFVSTRKQVLLGTAIVHIEVNGTVFSARALIDSGSQATFISEKLQRRLNLPVRKVNARVSGLNNALAGSAEKQCEFSLKSPHNVGFEVQVSSLVLPRLTGRLPGHTLDIPDSFSLGDLPLADPKFGRSDQVDILIGGDIYPQILLGGVRQNVLGSLVAQETIFGWILTGPISDSSPGTFTTYVSFCTAVELDRLLERFWLLEEPPKVSKYSPDDEYCEDVYKSTTTRLPDGRYVVSLPFRPQFANGKGLGLSRTKAYRQFLRNEVSLCNKPEFKSTYDGVLDEYVLLGHMTEIPKIQEDLNSFYLPHHAVIKPESTSTKVRVVFNASCKTSTGLSLNDTLYPGPILQNDLMLLIIRWRFYRFVFNGDIEKMYRQIWLHKEHTRFQRIVFRKDPKAVLKDFELKTVTFGVNCAPFLAIRTLLQLASDVEKELPLAAKILRHMMYVDDALAGAHEVTLAIAARDQLIQALSSAGFSMRKWTANDEKILQGLPSGHRLSENFLEIEDESNAKTLGIRWNAKGDFFYFSVKPIQMKLNFTKREVLSIIASLFDPAGWLGPVIVVAKILMQQIWGEGIGWDQELTERSHNMWNQFICDYVSLNHIKIPRWVGFHPSAQVELHGFSDASEKAYGACIYVRVVDGGSVQAHLLLAKSRVAPLKIVSLPRLELCGALLLADLMGVVRTDLCLDEKNTKFYCWSDSMIVLAWLQKPPSSWTTFVANRVSKILDKVGKDNWRHVRSECNPADLISRGVRPQDLIDETLWWQGPSWLQSPNSQWDKSNVDFATEEEERKVKLFSTFIKDYEEILDRFSSYARALRVMAYVFRFIDCLNGRRNFSQTSVSSEELQLSKERLVVVAQKVYFTDDYYRLLNNQSISNRSHLLCLNPFIDPKGLMRVGGRLDNATSLSYSEKHPLILPYNCRISRLLIVFVHQMTLHGGNQLMLRVLRTEFWIPRVKNLIRWAINRCRICSIMAKKTRCQLMASLPVSRTILDRAFTRTGVDFAGPYDIKNYTGRACLITKGYVCLFICFATRAVHLEAVSDLSSTTFLAAFSRFVSRRGCPKEMYSDNGTNFVGASKTLKSEFREFLKVIGPQLTGSYATQGISWHFNPASAPHMGGLWEAGVRSFKHHLRRIAGSLKYTFEEFSTLLARIEACLNSRPLCPISDDVSCLDALTPGHFLIGGPILAPPEPDIREAPESIVNRWQRVKALNQLLCLRWKNEYLKELTRRNKWKNPDDNVKVEDMVVIKEDNIPPNEWRLGRVTKVLPGVDQLVRVVEVKTERGLIVRPVVKLVVLPSN